jgi:hypothetical protein
MNPGADQVKLKRAFFVHVRNSESLLAMLGLKSRYSSSWRLNVLKHVSMELQTGWEAGEKEACQAEYARAIDGNLRQLIESRPIRDDI